MECNEIPFGTGYCESCVYYTTISEAELYGAETYYGGGARIPCCTLGSSYPLPIEWDVIRCSNYKNKEAYNE